jgi:hypothetical protein
LARCQQRSPPVQVAPDAQQLGNLAADDDQPDTGQVAADHRVGDVLDELPHTQQAQPDLQQAGQHADQHQQQHDDARVVATAHHVERKRREHRGGGRARCADQSGRAAERRGDGADQHRADDAGERTVHGVLGSQGGEDRDAKADGRRQGHQHRGQTSPQVALAGTQQQAAQGSRGIRSEGQGWR